MTHTIESDIELIKRQIESYEYEMGGEDHYCVFCEEAGNDENYYKNDNCRYCVLVRRFGKQCVDYRTFNIVNDEDYDDDDKYPGYGLETAIRNRIKSLKRMIGELRRFK